MTRPHAPSTDHPAFDRRRFLGAVAASAALALPIGSVLSAQGAHADPLPPTPPRTDFITWHEVPMPGVSPVASGIMADATGAVWYADPVHETLVRLEPLSGSTTEFRTGTMTTDMVMTRDGNVWFNSGIAATMGVLDPSTGSVVLHPIPTIYPDMTLAADGSIWFTDMEHGGIATIDRSGTVSTFTAPGSPSVEYIAGASDGSLWFSALGSGDIGRFDPLTGSFQTITTAHLGVTGLASTAAGPVWSGGPGKLQQFALDGSVLSTISVPSGTGSPRMLVPGVHAELFFRQTDLGIGRVNGDHSVTFMLPPFEKAAPMGLAVTPLGSVWFMHRFRETLGWF